MSCAALQYIYYACRARLNQYINFKFRACEGTFMGFLFGVRALHKTSKHVKKGPAFTHWYSLAVKIWFILYSVTKKVWHNMQHVANMYVPSNDLQKTYPFFNKLALFRGVIHNLFMRKQEIVIATSNSACNSR